MRGVKTLVPLCLLLATDTMAASQKITFEELPRLIEERNQHVQAASLSRDAAKASTGHLTRSYLPTLQAGVGGERFASGLLGQKGQPKGGIEARLNLFRSGKDRLEEDYLESQVTGKEAQRDQVYLDELTQARRSYWTIVYERELIEFLQEAITQNDRNLAAALRRIKSGIATDTDRIEFEMNGLQLKQDLARARLGNRNSQRTLSVLLGLAEDTEFETEMAVPHLHDDKLVAETFEATSHRDVRSALADKQSLELQSSRAGRWWAPSLDLYAGYNLYTQQERDAPIVSDRWESSVGFKLTVPLFDGLSGMTERRAALLRASAQENRAAQAGRQLKARWAALKQELEVGHDLIHNVEAIVNQARQYLSRTQGEYQRGVKNSVDMLNATSRYIETKRRAAELKRDYLFSRSEALATLGR